MRSEVDNAGRLHFEFDECQRIVLENDQLHRQLVLPQREQIAHEHRETAIARHGDHLPIRDG